MGYNKRAIDENEGVSDYFMSSLDIGYFKTFHEATDFLASTDEKGADHAVFLVANSLNGINDLSAEDRARVDSAVRYTEQRFTQ